VKRDTKVITALDFFIVILDGNKFASVVAGDNMLACGFVVICAIKTKTRINIAIKEFGNLTIQTTGFHSVPNPDAIDRERVVIPIIAAKIIPSA